MVLDLLQAPKRLGLTLTAGGMLVPEKSVTALVGISDPERGGLRAKVHALHQTDCPFPGRASGGSPRTLMFLFQPRERALSGARSRCLYLTRKGRLSQ